jgi:hypothetical protein
MNTSLTLECGARQILKAIEKYRKTMRDLHILYFPVENSKEVKAIEQIIDEAIYHLGVMKSEIQGIHGKVISFDGNVTAANPLKGNKRVALQGNKRVELECLQLN